MSDEKNKLSNDIRDWHYQVDNKKVVVFEPYENTLERSSKPEEENIEEDNEDTNDVEMSLKLKDLTIYNNGLEFVNLPEFNQPIKHFKLWTMYTTIPLTSRLLIKIEGTDGIESIEALSRYRARIGIGPLFKDGLVISKITKIIKDSTALDIKSLPNIS